MKPAGLGLVAITLCGILASPALAQRGEPGQYRGHGGPVGPGMSGPAMPGPGMSPYRSSTPPPGYRSSNPYNAGPSQSVPSTRFRSVPDHGRQSVPSSQFNPTYRAPGVSQHPGAPASNQAVPPDTSRMQQALRRGDYERLGNESRGVRSRADELQNMGEDLSVQDRLKLPLIKSMYQQGADMVDDGRSSRDDSKIKMGIQQINEANERVGRMRGDGPSERNGGGERSGSAEHNGRGNSGRRDRR